MSETAQARTPVHLVVYRKYLLSNVAADMCCPIAGELMRRSEEKLYTVFYG